MTAPKKSASHSTPQADALIERIHKIVQDRKGKIAKNIPHKDNESQALMQANAAIERIKTKEKTVRKWPKLLRSARRNQQAVNDGFLSSIENIITEGWNVRKMLGTQTSQDNELYDKMVVAFDKQIRNLAARVAYLETASHLTNSRHQHAGEASAKPAETEKAGSPEPTSLLDELQTIRVDAFYLAFEDEFRGRREMIKERLLDYIPFLSALKDRMADATALDIGCGRGEWLEVLKENDIVARGVDMNARMVAQCQSLGLDAECGDGIAHLQGLPSESQGIISGFHIVEHLTLPQLLELFWQSVRVLRPGGIAIFETPNPECLKVSTQTFYLDPTHRNPIPPELLTFIGTHTGFSEAKVERLHPYSEKGVFQGFGDYAGIFVK